MRTFGARWRAALAVSFLFGFAARSGAENQFASISLTNGQVALSWNCRGVLEVADEIAGPWNPVSGATSPYTNAVATTQRFYPVNQTVDATTLHKKVLCGHQGWFRCPGDGRSQWR